MAKLNGIFTDGEIISSYRQAKDKNEQIKILCQLTLLKRNEVVDILQNGGVYEVGVSKYDWELGKKLYDEGYSDKKIAESLGCDRSMVTAWRGRIGLPPNSPVFVANTSSDNDTEDKTNEPQLIKNEESKVEIPEFKGSFEYKPEESDSLDWLDRIRIIVSTMHEYDDDSVRSAYRRIIYELIDQMMPKAN